MFKRFFIVTALVSALSLNSFAQAPAAAAEQDKWNFDFHLFARLVGIGGSSLNKDAGDAAGALFFRIRPDLNISKGAFRAQLGLGTDLYFGTGNYDTPSGGGIHIGGTGATPTAAIQLRHVNVGFDFAESTGLYATFGMQDLYVPGFDDDIEGGMSFGWHNDMADVKLFYYALSLGSGRADKNLFDQTAAGGFFGITSTITAAEGLEINPYFVSLFQERKAYTAYDGGLTAHSWGYGDVAKFQDGVGIIPGINLSYTIAGFNLSTNFIMAYGKNNFLDGGDTGTLVKQTRLAGAITLKASYSQPDVFSTGLFFDFRSGDKDSGRKNGYNNSWNGATLEYDSAKAPLLILYDAGHGRMVPAYQDNSPDAYAFSDLGAVTIGAYGSYSIAGYTIGLNLGYAAYAAKESYMSSSSMGFELDLNQSYEILNGFKFFVEAGLLIPGKGLKEYAADNGYTGTAIKLNSQMPWLINAGFEYSV